MAKVTQLTKEEIEAKRDELKAKVSESKKKALVGRSSPAKDFLNEISDIVKDALKHNVSYKQLTKDIFDTYKFKVSEQTIRSFAHNVLGVEKQTRKINKNVIKATTSTTSVEDKAKNTTTESGRIKADINSL